MTDPTIDIPRAFRELLTESHRYFVYYGGRAAGKTYSIATALIVKSTKSRIKVLCCREIMDAITDSVYAVLVLRIQQMGLESIFQIAHNQITCTLTGSTFIFAGLFRNIEKIKSIPDITYAWINEAATISAESLTLLIPTIREEGSSLIFEFNPRYIDDAVYQRFIVNQVSGAFVKKVSWRDNPFISQTILQEKDDDYAFRPHEAAHIWEGELKQYGANIWQGWNKTLHIKEFDLKEIKDYKIFQALDPHTSFYSASIWAARWRQGNEFSTWVFKEWPSHGRVNAHYSDIRNKLHWTGSVADLAREFYAAESGLTVTQRYIDTRFAKGFGSKQSNLINTTEGIVQDFAKKENGGLLYLMPQEVHIDSAKDAITQAMSYNTLIPIDILNTAHFFVSKSCTNVIRMFNTHRYEEEMEKETETYKDFSDCVKILYAGLGEYRWPMKPKARPDQAYQGAGGWMGA